MAISSPLKIIGIPGCKNLKSDNTFALAKINSDSVFCFSYIDPFFHAIFLK
jgi:hypothetical protein